MQPHGASTKTWGNDDLVASGEHLKKLAAVDPKDEDYNELPTEDLMDIELDAETLKAETKNTALDSTLSDMDYLRSKMKPEPKDEATPADGEVLNVHPSRLARLDEEGAVNANSIVNKFTPQAEPVAAPATEEVQVVEAAEKMEIEEEIPSADLIADTGRLMVRNLPYTCTQAEVEELFTPFGQLVEVMIPISRETKQSKGYAFVLFLLPEQAVKAFVELDQTIFQGRIITIVPAKEKPKQIEETAGPHSHTFKATRERERKSNATNEFNWNSLYMNVY
jgi:multiple RNA-binding domain-containing protein 1